MKRKLESIINDWINGDSRDCLLITGARQVGKTFTIEQCLKRSGKPYITLNFELDPSMKGIFEGDSDVDRIMSRISVEFPGIGSVQNGTVLFLDEIQACPDARRSLKRFAVDGRFKVISSGSIMGLQYRSDSQNPVGYERLVEMRSMDFEEYLWAIGINQDIIDTIRGCIRDRKPLDSFILEKIDRYFTAFIVTGGMPASVSEYLVSGSVQKALAEKNKILDGYRLDIGKYSLSSQRDKIFATFDSIPFNLSQENKKYMYSRIEGRESVPSGRDYSAPIQWLIDSGIVCKCRQITDPRMPLEKFGSDRSFKLYMNDTGLLLSMMDPEVTASVVRGDHRVNRGAIIENVVAECIGKCGHDLYYLRTPNMEIDFITVMRGNIVAIEVKSGNNNRSKSLNSVKEKYGVKRRIKFENTNIRVTDDGIEHYPLFASAFLDSMYDGYDLALDITDVDTVNSAI